MQLNLHFPTPLLSATLDNCFFLTGLTSVLFEWLVTKITGSFERNIQKLTLEDHLLVILMKLRLGLCNTDLAYRFKVSNHDFKYFAELGPWYGLGP